VPVICEGSIVNDGASAHVDAMVRICEAWRNKVCAQRRLFVCCQPPIAAAKTPNTPPVRSRLASIAPTPDPEALVDGGNLWRHEHVASRSPLISPMRLSLRGLTCEAIRFESSMVR